MKVWAEMSTTLRLNHIFSSKEKVIQYWMNCCSPDEIQNISIRNEFFGQSPQITLRNINSDVPISIAIEIEVDYV